MIDIGPQELSNAVEQPSTIIAENSQRAWAGFFNEELFSPELFFNAKFDNTVRSAAKRRRDAAMLLDSASKYFGCAGNRGGSGADWTNFQ
jgi:hypothetical protein